MSPRTTLFTSCRADRRLEAGVDWLKRHARGDQVTLLLAVSRAASDDLVNLCSSAGRGGFYHRQTPYRFALELGARHLAAAGLAPLTLLSGEALAALVASDAREAGELESLASVSSLPGFAGCLARTLGELRLAGVAPDDLRGHDAKSADLGRLLSRYERELDQWQLCDRASLLHRVTDALGRDDFAYAGCPAVWLDLHPQSSAERDFLAALAGRLGAVATTAAAGDSDTIERLSTLVDRVVDLDRGGDDQPTAEPAGVLEHVQRYVFESQVPEPPPPRSDEPFPELDLFSAPGEGQECVEIARRLRDRASAGVVFDRMVVALRHSETYLPLIEDALRRARIPAYFSRGTARPHLSGRAFLSLLACAAEGLSATRFAEYLSFSQVPRLAGDGRAQERSVPWVEPDGEQLVLKSVVEQTPEPLPEPESPDSAAFGGSLAAPLRWERLLVDAAVVGGEDRWQRRLAGLANELGRRAREVGDEEPERRHALEQQIVQLEHLERFALPIINLLSQLPRGACWGDWLGHLEQLATASLRRPEPVLRVLAELRPMSRVRGVGLIQVRQVLAERLRFLRLEPEERRHGRVFVTTVAELAGRSFDVVFLPGLAEGLFPRRATEDPLLLDQLRAQLSGELELEEQRSRRERQLLRLAVGAARRSLSFSYPSVNTTQGRARVPSFYALDLLRAATGEVPEGGELEKSAAHASASRLGWPAPQASEQAIDDAEFDLALLYPLLDGDAETAAGHGRFLLECNAHLARSLRARGRRWRPRWSYADGLVLHDDADDAGAAKARQVLARHLPTARSYSPTALQHFAACPYRFLLQAVHRLRARDEIVRLEQLDPLTRGSIYHEVQFELFGALQQADLLPMREERLDAILTVADGVLEVAAARFEEELAPAIPRVWRIEIEGLRNDLRGWIRDTVRAADRYRPLHAELAFGIERGSDRDPASQSEPVELPGGQLLRGSIDLVEIDGDGKRLRVTDHKTGRAPMQRNVVIGGGEMLQPVLYALAAEQMLGGDRLEVAGGRLYYCTQRGGFERIDVELDQRARDAAQTLLALVDRHLEAGFLPAAPRPAEPGFRGRPPACSWCDYELVCGPYEHIRVGYKRQEPLAGLVHLRGLR